MPMPSLHPELAEPFLILESRETLAHTRGVLERHYAGEEEEARIGLSPASTSERQDFRWGTTSMSHRSYV